MSTHLDLDDVAAPYPLAKQELAQLREIIDEQRRTIEALMTGMPEDGTTPVIRRIAALEREIERLRSWRSTHVQLQARD